MISLAAPEMSSLRRYSRLVVPLGWLPPAPLMRMSTGPSSFFTLSLAASRLAFSSTLHATLMATPPSLRICAATVSAASCFKSATAIFAPHAASARDIVLHKTPPPPVTSATLSFKFTLNGMFILFSSVLGLLWFVLSVLKSSPIRPQPEGGVRNVKDFLAVRHRIPAVLEFGRIITLCHLLQVGVAEVDALDFLPREMAGAISDVEPAFRRAMDEMRRRAEIVLQLGVGLDCRQGRRRAAIAVLADEPVNLLVLAELLQSGRKHDQLATVGHRHTRAINALVAQPRALEFGGVQINDHPFERLVEHLEINLERERRGLVEAGNVVAHVETAHAQFAVVATPHHRVDIDDGQMFREMFGSVVENAPHRRVRASHHPFHAVGGADEMAFVDAFLAAGAHEDVLVVIGHTDDFVWDDLADGQDQIVFAGPDKIGQLRRPGKIHRAAGHLLHEFARHFADGGDARAPVMPPEQALRHAGEHLRDLRRRHGRMRAQRRQNVRQMFSIIIVNKFGQHPRVGMKAGEIRGNDEHPLARAKVVEGMRQSFSQVVQGQLVGYGTAFVIQHKCNLFYTTYAVVTTP